MKKTLFNSFIFLLFFIFQINAQSPYELKWKKELPIYGTGLAFGGAAYLFHKDMKVLTEMQINDFQAKGISSFESWATNQASDQSNKTSDIILYSSQSFPVILTLADKKMRKDFLRIGVLYSEVFLVNIAFTAFTKNTVRRTRPFVYNEDVLLEDKMTKTARSSFYSGHTSETASMCFLTARLFADYHPKSKWKPYVWGAAAIVPAATGFFRMRAGKHFPSDVAVGYVMGAAVGYFIPKLHKRKDKEEVTFIKHFK